MSTPARLLLADDHALVRRGVRLILDAEPGAVMKFVGPLWLYPADTPDTYYVNLRFTNGAIGRILGAFGIIEPPLPMETLQLFGTKGSLVHNQVVLDKIPGKPVMTYHHDPEQGFDGHDGEVRRYMTEFAQEIRQGIPSSMSALVRTNERPGA